MRGSPRKRLLTIFHCMATEVSEGLIPLTVNGSERQVESQSTLAQLLSELSLDPRMIVVEHNRVILRDRDQYDSIVLQANDSLELVHFVGGG